MFNKMKRFVAILLSALMLVSALPTSALAEPVGDSSVASQFAPAVSGVYARAEAVTVRVGEQVTLDGEGSISYSNRHEWTVSDDAIASVTQNSYPANSATVTGLREGKTTITHRYRQSFSGWRTETFTVNVLPPETGRRVVYIYTQTDSDNMIGTSLNKDGWYTIGTITIDGLPDASRLEAHTGRQKYAAYRDELREVLSQLTYDDVTLYSKNASVFTETLFNMIDWEHFGLCVAPGASDYNEDTSINQWHLDGYIAWEYKVLLQHYIECNADDPVENKVQHNGKWYKPYGDASFIPYGTSDFEDTLRADDNTLNIPNYTYVGANPETLTLSASTNNEYINLYYDRMVGSLTLEKALGADTTVPDGTQFTLVATYPDPDDETGESEQRVKITATYRNGAFTYRGATGTAGNTIEGLPVGTAVTISEDASGYEMSLSGSDGAQIPDNEITIAAEEQSVLVTNTRSTGDLTIVKALGEGMELNDGDSFTFTYEYGEGEASVEGTVTATWSDSQNEFTYTHTTPDRETVPGNVIEGIPIGTQVTVTEKESNGYKPTYAPGQTVTIGAEGAATITVTNDAAGRVGYYLVLPGASIDTDGWIVNTVDPSDTAWKYIVDGEYYKNGDTFTVTNRVPTCDGYVFVGWFDKAFGGSSAKFLRGGAEDTFNRANTDDKIQTLDAVWASLDVEDFATIYDGEAHSIPDPNVDFSNDGLRPEYQEQLTALGLSISNPRYATAENGTYSEDKPGFTNVGTHDVWVKVDFTVGGVTKTLTKKATVTIYPVLEVAKVAEDPGDQAFTFTLTKGNSPVGGAKYTVGEETHTTDSDGTFTLKAGQTAHFTGEGMYSGDVSSYPGTYTVSEKKAMGWKQLSPWDASLTAEAGKNVVALTFTNTRETVNALTVTKTWNTNGVQIATPDVELTIGRYADGVQDPDFSETVRVTANGGWTASLTGDFPTHDESGNAYTYAVIGERALNEEAAAVLEQYTPDYTATAIPANGDTALGATNTIGDVVTVTIVKNVVDPTRETVPDKFTINYAVADAEGNTLFTGGPVTLGHGEKATIAVPSGATVTVTEDTTAAWDVAYENNGVAFTADGTITVTNTRKTVSVSVEKVWNDLNDVEGTRPDSIQVALYAGETQVGEAVTLNGEEPTPWTYAWSDLPEYDGNDKIVYSVKELDVPDEYTSIAKSDESGLRWTITNTYTPDTVTVSGTKTWEGLVDGEAAPSVTVQLQKSTNGTEWIAVTGVATQSVADKGTYTFEDLPKYELVGDKYVEVQYRVVEIDLPTGVTSAGGTKDENYALTNSVEGNEVSVTVTKNWVDQSNKYATRPESVEVVLRAVVDDRPAEQYNETVTLGNGITGTDVVNEVSETVSVRAYTADGKKITYTLVEQDVPGYSVTYQNDDDTLVPADGDTTATLTNTLKTKQVTVKKVVDDPTGTYNNEEFDLTVTIALDGSEKEEPIQLAGDESQTFTVPEKATVTVVEHTNDAWTSSQSVGEDSTITVTNTRRIAENGIDVTKT